ncbi:MAG TPA: hypothetical protein VFE52_11530 [Devosia sp.]|nr:hypothetical protein [Devosia sp.]
MDKQIFVRRWITAGLLGLPLSGALTMWSSFEGQPDPAQHYAEWARFVSTDGYAVGHLLGSGGGLIAAIFGSTALGVALARTRASGMALSGMAVAVLGAALFLLPMGVSTFVAPLEGAAFLQSGVWPPDEPEILAGQLMRLTVLAVVVLSLTGHILLGVATYRSRALPRWTGVLWATAPVLMYPLGIVYAAATGVASTPPTVPVGAMAMALAGAGMVWSYGRGGAAEPSAAVLSGSARGAT